MSNVSSTWNVQDPPTCSLAPQPPLIPGISDSTLATIGPTIVYAVSSGFFYWLGERDLLSQYRIHPSQEEQQRNHVSRYECLRGVVRYHIMSISIGLLLSYGGEPDMIGNERCDVYKWATRIRSARKIIPLMLGLLSIDAKRLAIATHLKSPRLAHLVAGSPMSSSELYSSSPSGLTFGETFLAECIVSYAIPAFQFIVGLAVVDTWIYFTHRLCHINKTLYRELS